MESKIKNAIPKLTCGQDIATAFMVSNDIAITATHAIKDFFENESKIILHFNIEGIKSEMEVEPLIGGIWKNNPLVALKLGEEINDIVPFKCINYKNEVKLKCESFGYPSVRSNEGTLTDFSILTDNYHENWSTEMSWNLDLKNDDNIKDYSGFSGGPLIYNGNVLGILINQIPENYSATRLGGLSLYIFKDYFEEIGIDLVEIKDIYYENYLNLFNKYLNTRLTSNIISRSLSGNVLNDVNSSSIEVKKTKFYPYEDFINLNRLAIILSEPGGGKTYLILILAKTILDNNSVKNNKIPIILKAKNWFRSYNTIIEGIQKELNHYIMMDINQIEKDLRDGKYLLLIDGLDEVIDSKDLLIEELIKISNNENMQIFVTCRKDNYYNQLYPNFVTFKINPLNKNQIDEYVEKELNQSKKLFLNNNFENVKELLKNPLLLFMTVINLKKSKDKKLSKNKADLYSKYTKYLLDYRLRERGSPSQLNIDSTTQKDILSDYAYKTFKKTPKEHDFIDSVVNYITRDNVEAVKNGLLEKGILIQEDDYLTFFHPSFQEYFVAIYVSQKTDQELGDFIQENMSDDYYFEVFIFLSGILKSNNRQRILLDFLEKNNLYLYRNCLESRFNFSSHFDQKWSEESTKKYFEQVRQSYLEIINNHFKFLKEYFFPWVWENGSVKGYDVIIEGAINFNNPSIYYKFLRVNEDSEKPRVIIDEYEHDPIIYDNQGNLNSSIMSLHSRNYEYLNLSYTDLGIDSAREVALDSIRKQLNDLLEKENLFMLEPSAMLITLIEDVLSKLPRKFWIKKDNNLVSPSLYNNSLDELLYIFNERKLVQDESILSSNLKINVLTMFISLCRLKQEFENIYQENFLPKADISIQDLIENSNFTYSCSIWDLWSEKQLCDRIAKFFEFYQLSYRYFVEKCFYSIKDYLPFYAMGPLRFDISINKIYEDSLKTNYYYAGNIIWEPVENIEDIGTIVNLNLEKANVSIVDLLDQRKRDIMFMLSKLNRKNFPFPSSRSGMLDKYLKDENLRKKVYQQLKNDINYVLGEL